MSEICSKALENALLLLLLVVVVVVALVAV
jgi:hypothetical protein